MTATVPSVPSGFTIPRWPQNDDELYWFTQAIWGTRIPRHSVCPEHTSPFQAFADAYFARYPVTIWYGSRGFSGKTHTLATLTNTEAVCLAADSSILGGSAAQSLNVNVASQAAWHWHMAPKHLLSQDMTKYDTWLTNGAHIRSLMASQTSVRGPHPQRLRLDEIDEMELPILEAAQGQPMRKKKAGKVVETQTVMSSTWQYPEGTFATIKRRAEAAGWPVMTWCYKETANPIDGWLTMDEIERQRTVIPRAMWEAEYDLQEPSFQGRAIDPELLELAFDPRHSTNEDRWVLPMEERLSEYRHKKATYVTSVDWAKERDRTFVITFDASSDPWWVVEVQCFNKLPWPATVHRAESQYRKYGGYFIHDATGLGNVISDYIDPQLKRRARFIDFVMSGGRGRMDFFNDYIAAIEAGHIMWPRIDLAYREHKYCTNDDLFSSGSKNHPPDSMVAGCLAWFCRRFLRHGVTLPQSWDKEMSGWDLSSVNESVW